MFDLFLFKYFFFSVCQRLENLSLSLNLQELVQEDLLMWRSRYQLEFFSKFHRLTLKSIVIQYCNRKEIVDCHTIMGNFIKRIILKHSFQLECLWAPKSLKNDLYLFESEVFGGFERLPFNLKNMLTWVCIKLT